MALIHDTESLKRRIKFWWLIPLVFVLGFYIAPALQTTENVTVLLDGCLKASCELKGDLTVNPLTGDFVLTQADGTEITFAEERVSFMDVAK